MSNKTYRVLLEKLGGTNAANYIGNEGELFYDPTTTTLRVADGSTPGGTTTGGGSSNELTNGSATVSLGSDGTLTLPANNEITSTSTNLELSTTGGSWIGIEAIEEETASVYFKATDDLGNSAEWSLTSQAKMICPANTEIVTQLSGSASVSVGVYDLNSSSRINATTVYQPSANGAYTTMQAYDNNFNSAYVMAIAEVGAATPLAVNLQLYDGGAVYGTSTYSFMPGRMNFPIFSSSYRPATPVGSAGDKQGDIIFGDNGIYVCKANYDGTTAIWGKSNLNFSWE
jgi:hypothetical protein